MQEVFLSAISSLIVKKLFTRFRDDYGRNWRISHKIAKDFEGNHLNF
jgi:hypothetical protein